MSPMHKSITALAASALLATVGFATAQSTDGTTTDANGTTTTTTTTVDTATQVIPAQPTGVVELAKPKNTVTPDRQAARRPAGHGKQPDDDGRRQRHHPPEHRRPRHAADPGPETRRSP